MAVFFLLIQTFHIILFYSVFTINTNQQKNSGLTCIFVNDSKAASNQHYPPFMAKHQTQQEAEREKIFFLCGVGDVEAEREREAMLRVYMGSMFLPSHEIHTTQRF